jgi:ubiquinone/menaquinone biosynthesis C-methylase UbiE
MNAGRREFFNELAAEWDNRYGKGERAESVRRVASRFDLGEDAVILDVGSGTGAILPRLLEAAGRQGFVCAVDYSVEMIRRGRNKFAGRGPVGFQVAAAEFLPCRSGRFDHVVCFGLFPHLDNRQAALREFRRVLKPGGTLIIAHALSSEEIKNHHGKAPPVRHDCLPERDEMLRLLETEGFSVAGIVDEPGCYLCDARRGDARTDRSAVAAEASLLPS